MGRSKRESNAVVFPKTCDDPVLEIMRKRRFRYLWENMAKSRRINLEFTQMLPYLHSQELLYLEFCGNT
jgi:hypothetical protein